MLGRDRVEAKLALAPTPKALSIRDAFYITATTWATFTDWISSIFYCP